MLDGMAGDPEAVAQAVVGVLRADTAPAAVAVGEGPLARGAGLLGLVQAVDNRSDYAFGDLILHSEKIADLTIRPLGPYMCATPSVDELRGNADSSSYPAYATFQHVLNAQLASNLLHGRGPPLEGE